MIGGAARMTGLVLTGGGRRRLAVEVRRDLLGRPPDAEVKSWFYGFL